MRSCVRLALGVLLVLIQLAGSQLPRVTPSAEAQAASSPLRTLPVDLDVGWNLIDLPLQSSIDSSGALGQSIDASLGAKAVSAVATYASGRFQVAVPGFGSIPLNAAQGIFVLVSSGGTWQISGTTPDTAPVLPLQ